MKQWVGKFDPEKFDLAACNATLASHYEKPRKYTTKKKAS